MRARALAFMGRADDEWLARIRAFAALSAEGESELLAASLDAAMRSELHRDHGDAHWHFPISDWRPRAPAGSLC